MLGAGCTAREPAAPQEQTWSPFIEEGDTNYGFLAPSHGEFGSDLRYIGLERGGRVVAVTYRVQTSEGAWRLDLPAHLEDWRSALEPRFRDGVIYDDGPERHAVSVVGVRETTLTGPDLEKALAAIDAGLAAAKPPGPGNAADCGYNVVRTANEHVRLNCGGGDEGWSQVHRQLRMLWDDLHAPAQP